MIADYSDWLIEHYHRYQAGSDRGFMNRYDRRLMLEAKARGWSATRLLDRIDQFLGGEQLPGPAPLILTTCPTG